MLDERRRVVRSKFTYYMRLIDNTTQQLIGYLADISPQGFQLDCPHPLLVNKDYSLRMDLTVDISDRAFIAFVARCRWSHPDDADPFSHDAGFQLVSISAGDNEVFQRIVAKYGTQKTPW